MKRVIQILAILILSVLAWWIYFTNTNMCGRYAFPKWRQEAPKILAEFLPVLEELNRDRTFEDSVFSGPQVLSMDNLEPVDRTEYGKPHLAKWFKNDRGSFSIKGDRVTIVQYWCDHRSYKNSGWFLNYKASKEEVFGKDVEFQDEIDLGNGWTFYIFTRED